MDIIDDILKVDNTEIQLTQEEAIRYLDIWKSVTRDYKIVGFIDATEEAKRLLREFRDRIEPEENRMIKVFTLFFDYWCYFRFEDGNALNYEILVLLKKILTQHPVAIEMDKRFREKWQKICDSDSEDESLHIGEDTEYSEELDRLREETTSLEGIKELQKRIQELEEENQLQRNEIDRLTEKLEDKEDTQPRHGRPANSGLNRNERTALLMELLAGVTGIDATDLTGVSSNIQGQGLKALSCVSGLIVDISAGQRSKVLSEYREYQKKGQHEKIKEHRLQPERTNVVALIKEIEARKKQRGKG